MRSFDASSLMPGQGTRRLFIGLMATAAAQTAIDDYRSMWHWPSGARLTRVADLHVTLHFLGNVAEIVEDELRDALDRVPVRSTVLSLQDCEVWPGGAAVLKAQPDEALTDMHHGLARELLKLALPVDRRPYTPHVTLARHADGATWPRLYTPIAWTVSSYSLMWSRGGVYQELERWPAQRASRPR